MKQLLINEVTKRSALKYQKDFIVKRQDVLDSLIRLKVEFNQPNEIAYLDSIISNYDNIIVAEPFEIKNLLMPTFSNLSDRVIKNNSFANHIISAMKYKDVREHFFINVLRESEINTCVYCHSQSLVIVDILYKRSTQKNGKNYIAGDIRKQKAFLELDHYYSKANFPFLCTSFYNLYPICSSCNKSKKDKKLDFFEFYIGDESERQFFEFKISEDSKAKFLSSFKKEDIEVKLLGSNSKNVIQYNRMFNIDLRYNKYKDIIEELFHKHNVYNNIYKDSIETIINSGRIDEALFKRIIVGNYTKEDEVFKRPLAKLYQDIAKQIGII